MNITELLFSLQDEGYRDFHSALMPTINKESVIGVRAPLIRKIAKKLTSDEARQFIKTLPHSYYEENNLHAFIIAGIKDFDLCTEELDRFLPYVDNWATCDGMNPKVLGENSVLLMEKIDVWLQSDRTYTVRFAIKCLMDFYLDKNFSPDILKLVADVRSDEYYVNMMCAWFFATALYKQPEETLRYFTEGRLIPWVHNKAISKACDSYRIERDMKERLRGLRIK